MAAATTLDRTVAKASRHAGMILFSKWSLELPAFRHRSALRVSVGSSVHANFEFCKHNLSHG